MKHIKLLMLVFVFFSVSLFGETRAALDIGSGATKLRIAEVDERTNRIQKILFDDFFVVEFQESLEKSPDGAFNQEIMDKGVEAMKWAKKTSNDYGAEKVVAIATAAFRTAKNAQEFVERIEKETGVEVYIINQELEGELAFKAALSNMGANPEGVIVWDIGGGSLQLTALNSIYRGHEASVPFKNHIIEKIQNKKGDTPNPMSLEDIEAALAHSRELAKQVGSDFKSQIQKSQIAGVGSIFGIGIYDLMGERNRFTQKELQEKVVQLHSKTDDDVGGGPFASVAISNPILILGFMQELGINEITIVDVNNSDGAMVYEDYWKKEEKSSCYCCCCR